MQKEFSEPNSLFSTGVFSLFSRINGHSKNFALEHQMLNWILIFLAFLTLLFVLINILEGIPLTSPLIAIAILFLMGYYFVRFKRKYIGLISTLLFVFCMSGLTLAWFENAGIEGSTPLFFISPFYVSFTILRGWRRWVISSVTIMIFMILTAIQYTNPDLIAPYPSLGVKYFDILFSTMIAIMFGVSYVVIILSNLDLRKKQADDLLLNILPEIIAEELKHSPAKPIAQSYENTTILFADIVNFTPMSANMTPVELVSILDDIFSDFDALVAKYDLEKIKTIGDCYMVAAGVPHPRSDHAHVLACLALDIREYARKHTFQGKPYSFRIGLNSGSIVAGVIGRKKFVYDLWGDAVNTASRMESHGTGGFVQVTESTYELIKNDFTCEPRGTINVKGKGELKVWYIVDKK